LSKTSPLFKKLYDSLVAFRGASLIWFQVAELSFDSFMIRMCSRA
jgi:TRAP-type mannitol/chloroaromatic compound transport system substrate-binding protein